METKFSVNNHLPMINCSFSSSAHLDEPDSDSSEDLYFEEDSDFTNSISSF
jgi:hypothetical protein